MKKKKKHGIKLNKYTTQQQQKEKHWKWSVTPDLLDTCVHLACTTYNVQSLFAYIIVMHYKLMLNSKMR